MTRSVWPTRPVLIALNSKSSKKPGKELYPFQKGYRMQPPGFHLYDLLRSRTSATRAEYLRVFDRMYIFNRRLWTPDEAVKVGYEMWRHLIKKGAEVVVLGRAAVWSLGLDINTEPIFWHTTDGIRWLYLPYPAGWNRFFRGKERRAAAAMVLEELYYAHLYSEQRAAHKERSWKRSTPPATNGVDATDIPFGTD